MKRSIITTLLLLGTIQSLSGFSGLDDGGDSSFDRAISVTNQMELSIGGTVWSEAASSRDAQYQLGIDFPIGGLNIELFWDQNGDEVAQLSEFVQSTQTNSSGEYLFSDLDPGDFFVVIQLDQILIVNSIAVIANGTANDDVNNDSNGLYGGPYGIGSITSGLITLTLGGEPTNDGDNDPNTNLSIDFGFEDIAFFPVELSDFNFVTDKNEIQLRWTTLSESNNLGFTVEISSNDSEYKELGFVSGKGNSVVEQNYDFVIENLDQGIYFVRLRQTDFDGAHEYFGPLEVVIDLDSSIYLSQAYPNPFRSSANFDLMVQENQNVEISLLSILGKEISKVHSGELSAHILHAFKIDTGDLSNGQYFLLVKAANEFRTRSLTILK